MLKIVVKEKHMYTAFLLTLQFLLRLSVQSSKSSELRVLEFKKDCMQGLSNIVKKIQEKSPLKYPTVRQMECLDPSVMIIDPDGCKAKMKGLVQTFLVNRQLAGGVCAGRSSGKG